MSLFVKFTGMTAAISFMRPLPETVKRQTVFYLAEAAEAGVRSGAARHNKSGATAKAIFNRLIPQGREVGIDATRAPQAIFVNLGTKPHVIRPKKGKALRWSAGGGAVFASRVNHPGYRGDPYVFDAATEALRGFAAIVNKAFEEAQR